MDAADDLLYRSAQDQAREIRDGSISSVELLDMALEHVAKRNGAVNAIVALDAARARERAMEIDAGLASSPDDYGPLAGVPITIKDSMMVQGAVVTSGAPELASYVAPHDADSVARLKAAGAVVFGKTNLPIWAGDVQTFNELFGTTGNPWDLDRTCGGSSGGAAAALAAGFTPLEVGSDIAGSIRNPSAMCGVVGHKPSYGAVSARGQIPGPPGTLTLADIAVVGPMARTVADARLGLELLAGPDDWTSAAWSLQFPAPRAKLPALDPSGLRVAVWANDAYCPVDPEIEAAILATAAKLEQGGAVVSTTARPDGFDFAKADSVFLTLLGAAMAGGYSTEEIEEMAHMRAEGQPSPGGLGVQGAPIRHREWLTNNERRLQMRRRWKEFFEDWDVLLAPVAPTVAHPHIQTHPMTSRTIDVAGETRPYADLMKWMGLIGVAWLPATAVPLGLHSSGLPLGLQVVGPYLEDLTCLAAAEVIEAADGNGFRRPPGW